MKKIFTLLLVALTSISMSAEEVLNFTTVCKPDSNVTFTQGSVTVFCYTAIADGFFLNNRGMVASVTNSDATTLITATWQTA